MRSEAIPFGQYSVLKCMSNPAHKYQTRVEMACIDKRTSLHYCSITNYHGKTVYSRGASI